MWTSDDELVICSLINSSLIKPTVCFGLISISKCKIHKLTCKFQLRRRRDVSAPRTDLRNKEKQPQQTSELWTTLKKITMTRHVMFILTFLLLPHVQLLRELRHNQEGFPALTLLRFEDVAKRCDLQRRECLYLWRPAVQTQCRRILAAEKYV